MALSTASNKVIHDGNGVATIFSFTFPILEASHLSVIYTDTGGNAITLSPSLYSVTGIGSLTGGSVTYPLSGPELAAGETLTLLRTVPLTQTTVLSNQGGYYPEVVEGRFDRIYMALQQHQESVARMLKAPASDEDAPADLPGVAARAGKYLGFDNDGNPIPFAGTGGSAEAMEFLQAGSGAISRNVRDKLRDTIDLLDFGVVYDDQGHAAANSIAVAAFLQACGAEKKEGRGAPGRTVWMNPTSAAVAGDLKVDLKGTIFKNAMGADQDNWLLWLTGDASAKCIWDGGHFDCNGGPRGGFRVADFGFPDVIIDGTSNMVGSLSSTGSDSGLYVTNYKKARAGWRHMHDHDEGTSILGSVPRCFSASTGQTDSEIVIEPGLTEDVHCVNVIGNTNGGRWIGQGGKIRRATDNGYYEVSDSVSGEVNGLDADDIDEAIVADSATSEVEVHGLRIRNARNAIGMQDCPRLAIYDSRIHNVPGAHPFKTRLNTASGALEVYRSHMKCRPSARVVSLGDSGTAEDFIDIDNTWDIEIDPAIQSTQLLFNMSPGDRCRVWSQGSLWIIRDAPDADPVTATSQFINMPTVTEQSGWYSTLLNLCSSSSSHLRVSAIMQELFGFDGQFFVNSVNAIFESNYGEPGKGRLRFNRGTFYPSAGTHNAGDVVIYSSGAAGGKVGAYCTAGGSPGTWKPFGAIDA